MALPTAASAGALTLRPPFSTRDTVPLDTPARAATSSMVGRPRGARRPVTPAPAARRPPSPRAPPAATLPLPRTSPAAIERLCGYVIAPSIMAHRPAVNGDSHAR